MSDAGESTRQRRNHALRVVAFITFVGPLIGCAIFLVFPIVRLALEATLAGWSMQSIPNPPVLFC